MTEEYLFTFRTSHEVFKAEKDIKTLHNVHYKLIPTPREISSECGFSLILNKRQVNFSYKHVYSIKKIKGKMYYEKIN